jgi:surface-anchored protein
LLATAFAALGSLHAVTLETGEVDVGVGYADGAWDLHAHDETTDIEYEPGEVTLLAGPASQTTVPIDLQYSFLGSPGAPTWILPQVEDPELLYLGLATEEIALGVFEGDVVTFSLTGITGPGHFALYSEGGFGDVTLFFNSADGITSSDSMTLPVGSHQHLNWAFSAPGSYSVEFTASGILQADGMPTTSGPVAYSFEVVPEPGTVGLLVIAGLAMVWIWRPGRRATARNR